jgi:hypothetical protein
MKLATFGTYGLHTIQYPSKRWGYVGTIPEILCIEKKGSFNVPYMDSRTFDTEEEAIKYYEDHKHLINS